MYLTKEDYIKIEKWLQSRAIKDTELPSTDKVEGNDLIPIIQDSKNRTVTVETLLNNIKIPDTSVVDEYNKPIILWSGTIIGAGGISDFIKDKDVISLSVNHNYVGTGDLYQLSITTRDNVEIININVSVSLNIPFYSSIPSFTCCNNTVKKENNVGNTLLYTNEILLKELHDLINQSATSVFLNIVITGYKTNKD